MLKNPFPLEHSGSMTLPGVMVRAEMSVHGKPPTRRSTSVGYPMRFDADVDDGLLTVQCMC